MLSCLSLPRRMKPPRLGRRSGFEACEAMFVLSVVSLAITQCTTGTDGTPYENALRTGYGTSR
jgi:hypothetical protein